MQPFRGSRIEGTSGGTVQAVVVSGYPFRRLSVGMTMNSGLHAIQWTGFARVRGILSSGKFRFEYFRSNPVWVPAVVIAGLGAWMLLSGYVTNNAESEPQQVAAAVTEPAPPVATPASDAAQGAPSVNLATAPSEAITPAETAPVDGLRISSQSWRRGGLGSKALVTFTLRNGNDYAVKDIEIACAFARRDGSHLTDRTRLIPDTVNMKSRKTFSRVHVGFVNINANKAKCSLVTASHI
jgi:hypothetical protein